MWWWWWQRRNIRNEVVVVLVEEKQQRCGGGGWWWQGTYLLSRYTWYTTQVYRIRLGSTNSMLRCCFALLLLIDKAAACAAFAAAFNAQPENWTLLDCNIECCTGDNCNNQYLTPVLPTMVYTTTPNPVSPTSESHGR